MFICSFVPQWMSPVSNSASITLPDVPRLPDEPERWYARFLRYVQLGPSRSLRALYQAETGKQAKPSGAYQIAYRRYRWQERAATWDAYQHEKELTSYEERNAEARRILWNSIQTLGKLSEQINAEIEQGGLSLARRKEQVALIGMIHDIIHGEFGAVSPRIAPGVAVQINNVNAQSPGFADLSDEQIDRILADHRIAIPPHGEPRLDDPPTPSSTGGAQSAP